MLHRLKNKGISPLIASVFVLAITIAGIVIVMDIGKPVMEKGRENSLFTEAKQNMKIFDTTIESVKYEGVGSSRRVNIKASGGNYVFNSSSDEIKFIRDMKTDLLPVGLCDGSGGLKIKTYGVNRVLDIRLDEGSGNLSEDCSKYGNRGTLEPDTANGPEWVRGKFGSALEFDGSDDYVRVEDSSSLDLTDRLTLAAWVNPSNTTGIRDVIAKSGSYRLTIQNGGEVCLSMDGVGTGCTTRTLPEGEWHHISATWDGDTAEIYIDGESDLTETMTGTLAASSNNLGIGAETSPTQHHFSGRIDEVVIYGRALLPDEIKEISRGGTTGNARKLVIELDGKDLNITRTLTFGRGTHSLLFKNKGYESSRTQIDVIRI